MQVIQTQLLIVHGPAVMVSCKVDGVMNHKVIVKEIAAVRGVQGDWMKKMIHRPIFQILRHRRRRVHHLRDGRDPGRCLHSRRL